MFLKISREIHRETRKKHLSEDRGVTITKIMWKHMRSRRDHYQMNDWKPDLQFLKFYREKSPREGNLPWSSFVTVTFSTRDC